MDFRRLYLGSLDSPQSGLTHVHGYLALHPSGVIMIDTGFGVTVVGDSQESSGVFDYGGTPLRWVRRTTVEALADHGLEPKDIRYVINTHLFDHAGDNHMFPEATFIVQRPEWESQAGSACASAWDFPGVNIQLLDGEDSEVLPGVTCLFTPGHTAGHQSVLVEDGDHTTLFVGDAAYFIDVWEDPDSVRGTPAMAAQVGVPDGWDTWLRSLDKLKRANADTVHFSHDPRILTSETR